MESTDRAADGRVEPVLAYLETWRVKNFWFGRLITPISWTTLLRSLDHFRFVFLSQFMKWLVGCSILVAHVEDVNVRLGKQMSTNRYRGAPILPRPID